MASESSLDNTEIKETQVSIDVSPLLEFLVEESQVDEAEAEAEEERLQCIIRSLEAEIDPPDGCRLAIAPDLSSLCKSKEVDYCEPHYIPSEDGGNWLGSYMFPTDDFDWLDAEMTSSFRSHDMGKWYMENSCNDELDRMEHSHACLWQETYDSVIYNN